MKEVNLDDILSEYAPITCSILTTGAINSIKAAINEACKQVLELAAENAYCSMEHPDEDNDLEESDYLVDKQSILNTINQVK